MAIFKDSEDLLHGQIVIVTARWILVLAGFLLTLWAPDAISSLRAQIMVLLLLGVGNFYLHAQVLMKRPTVPLVVYAASAADLTVITIFVLVGGGFESTAYTFYIPALLAFSVVFPTVVTVLYAAGTMFIYAVISLATMLPPGGLLIEDGPEVLLARLVMLAAIAVCGNMYWRIERGRREAAFEAQDALLAEIGARAAASD